MSAITHKFLKVDGLEVTLIFIDSTKGWIVTDDGSQSSAVTAAFVSNKSDIARAVRISL